MRTIYKYAGCF